MLRGGAVRSGIIFVLAAIVSAHEVKALRLVGGWVHGSVPGISVWCSSNMGSGWGVVYIGGGLFGGGIIEGELI